MPRLFTGAAMAKLNKIILSTSTLSSDALENGGLHPNPNPSPSPNPSPNPSPSPSPNPNPNQGRHDDDRRARRTPATGAPLVHGC